MDTSIKKLRFDKSLVINIIKFTFPLILTNLLQQLYVVVDSVIAGKFAGELIFSAIGATNYLSTLLTNFVVGISVGVSAVVSQTIGKGDKDQIHKVIHTSVAVGLCSGALISAVGVIFCRPLLMWLDTPAAILDLCTSYMKIIFGGYVIASVYNFGIAIMRARGNTALPLKILIVSGFAKTILTAFFVIVLKLGIESIATSTIISQLISAVCVMTYLMREDPTYRVNIKKIKIYGAELVRVLRMGIPIGIQTSMFSISNVLIQSSINSFGEIAVGGASAAAQINSLLYTMLTATSHTATIFCSRYFGAKQNKKVLESLVICLCFVCCFGLAVGYLFHIFTPLILGLFVSTEVAFSYGAEIAAVICIPYFLCGSMEVMCGGLRAINKSTLAMISSVVGLCGFRILWIYTYFSSHRSLGVLYYSYPLSWFFTLTINTIFFVIFYKKLVKNKTV